MYLEDETHHCKFLSHITMFKVCKQKKSNHTCNACPVLPSASVNWSSFDVSSCLLMYFCRSPWRTLCYCYKSVCITDFNSTEGVSHAVQQNNAASSPPPPISASKNTHRIQSKYDQSRNESHEWKSKLEIHSRLAFRVHCPWRHVSHLSVVQVRKTAD